MSRVKAKPVRLVDMLGLFSDDDMVVVRFRYNTKPTHSNYVRLLKAQLDAYLGCNVIGVTASGAVNILIDA